MKVLPTTSNGRFAVYLMAITIIVLFGATTLLANTLYSGVIVVGDGIVGEFRQRPLMPIFGISGILSGLISFAMSLIALFGKKDRSLSVLVAAIVGLLLVVLLLGEFIGFE